MKKFKQLRESKYGDAMSSRLPAHLDDPRVEPKVAKKPVKRDPKDHSWKLYREEAKRNSKGTVLVESAELDVPTHTPEEIANKHGFTLQHIHAQVQRGIRDEMEHTTHSKVAEEIALDHLWQNPNYYTALKKAQLEGCLLEEGLTPREKMSGDERLKPVKPAPVDQNEKAKKLTLKGYQMNKKIQDAAKKSNDTFTKSLRQSDLKESEVAFNESGGLKSVAAKHGYSFSHTQSSGAKVYAHHQGHMLVDDPTDKHWHHYHKDQAYTTSDRALRGQGLDSLGAHLTHFHGKGKTPLAESTEAYKVGDKVVAKIGPHKGTVHTVIHVHPTGHLNIKPDVHVRSNRYHLGAAKADPKDVTRHLGESTLLSGRQEKPLANHDYPMTFHKAIAHAKKNGNRVTFGTGSRKWHSIDSRDRDYHTSFALDPDEAKRHGEAKSLLLSTASRHLEEAKEDNYDVDHMNAHLCAGGQISYSSHNKGCPTKSDTVQRKMRNDMKKKIKNYNTGINRKTIQEIFQAAKDKKDGKPPKEDALPNDGANEPNKDVPGAPGVQPQDAKGPQDGAPGTEKKKDNTPVPENASKSKKIQVKGPGVDDKFQPDPIVTPLTTMPDTSSPKSGSQGVR
jgi:hypothetical protein